MTLDYKKLGMKAGLEIHQQLDTKKLFCSCPSLLRDDSPNYTFKRELRSVVGETGKIDIAASHEHRKQKIYKYEGFTDTTCQIEADEQPPNSMNEQALNIALQVSFLLKAKIIDTIQVMRKTVVDGSNTSGFQRTALIAINGDLSTSEGKVSIPYISIEEDAARKITEDKFSTTYRLDRLGIPLIEIGTGPDLKSPEQVKEAAETLGMILRSTGKVKRGLGTIRQDVNISIKKGERIEVKGAQELKTIPRLVEYECLRQINLLQIKDDLPKNIKFEDKELDVSNLFNNTESKVIDNALKNDGIVLALRLPKLAGFLGKEIQPGRRLGTELSDYAKIASGVGGIFHSDELPKYGITEKDVTNIKSKLDCKKADAFIVVADLPRKAEIAIEAALSRAKLIQKGVIKEVRKAGIDGTTSYLRPIPGAARLYPETDVIPITPNTKNIDLPELLSEKAERICKKLDLSKDLSTALTKSDKFETFEHFVENFKEIKPAYIGETLLTSPKQVQKQYKVTVDPEDDDYFALFAALNKGNISKDSVLEILSKINETAIEEVILDFKLMSNKELETEIKNIINTDENLPFNALIGKVMGKLKGKADGKKIVELVKKNI